MFTPAPDPTPQSHGAPITYVAYDYTTAALNKRTHRTIHGVYFLCHVRATGQRHCILIRGVLPPK